jgi:predicted dehydrogenase
MGNTHARQYRKMDDVELFFYDRDASRLGSFAETWQAKPQASIEDLISAVDVVDVCLPTDLHVDAGLKAVAAGRAIFVEKPVARELPEAVKLKDAIDKAGVPAMVGQVVRFFPEYAAASRQIKQGAIGTPSAARTRRGGGAPKGSQGWFLDHHRSGGVLLDLAIHDFDFLRWTIGEVKHLYSRSVAMARGNGGPDYALTTITFENGCVGHVESTWMDPSGFRTTFDIAGSKGLVQHDSRSNVSLRTVKPEKDDVGNHMPGSSSSNESPWNEKDDPYYLELKAFLDAVADGTPPPVTMEDGLKALAIALAAIESAKTGEVVKPATF